MSHEELDDFNKWNEKIKDYDEFYSALLQSTRSEMSRWMKEINAQFISQVGLTVDRLNGASRLRENSNCSEKFRVSAGIEIQDIIRRATEEIDFYQRDYVYLLADVTDQYVSFNQKWPKRVWTEWNMVTRMDIITYLMETYVYKFYKMLFEVQVEEILIDMGYFRELMNETRQRTFVSLLNVGGRIEKSMKMC